MNELLVERSAGDGRVAEIVLDRPERRNALTASTVRQLTEAVEALHADADVAAVLLRGAGGCFCSGIDLAELPRDPDDAASWSAAWVALHTRIAELDVPVVAAVQRAAVNAGAALALAADLMVVGDSAFLQVQEVARGMVPWVNVAWLCARHGQSRALDLTLTGRRCDGPELHRLGIAHLVVADDDVVARARTLATALAEHPRAAMASTKGLIRAVTGEGSTGPVAALGVVGRAAHPR